MDDLKKAIVLRQEYMNMDFDTFSKKVEDYIKKAIPQKEKDDFKFTGLSNIDFFRMYVEC